MKRFLVDLYISKKMKIIVQIYVGLMEKNMNK